MSAGRSRSTAFGSAAEAYDRYRPSPAAQALDWLLRPRDRDVVDIGAGTGQLSRMLVARGVATTAVEPDPEMRRVLRKRVPQAAVAEGVAERLPLADRSQDIVLAHAAAHWFDPGRWVAEAARVLRPGGRVGALATSFDPELDWVEELWRRLEPDGSGRRPGAEISRLHRARLFGGPGARFTRQQHRVFHFTCPFTADELLGLMGTYSGFLVRSSDERAARLASLRMLLEQHVPPGATAQIPMVTHCWRADRRA